MNCPTGCATALVMTDRQGVEIDYCPTCRGVWLDRGELDKIIDRAAQLAPAPASAPPPPAPPTRYERDDWNDDGHRGARKKKKRGSFLEDMFDFG
jgi:Zn-finger nucleic acid-binding protein